MKSIAYTTTALAFAGALAISNPARAEDMQVSGTSFITQVESHFIPDAGNPTRGFAVEVDRLHDNGARVCRCTRD